MKLASNVALLALLLTMPACETVNAIAQSVNVNALLASITDGQSATAAKPALDGVVAHLSAALAGTKAEGEANAAEGEGMVASVLAKFGVTPETTSTINNLLDMPEVKTVLGGTLNQLTALITG